MKLAFKIQKGTLAAVSREVIRSYVILKEKYPDYNENQLSSLIFERWLPINRERIWEDESETRYLRFEEVCTRREDKNREDNIFTVFFDILYIENGTEPSEKQNFRNAAKTLYKDAKDMNLNFKAELKIELQRAKRHRRALRLIKKCRHCEKGKEICRHCILNDIIK